MLPEIEACRKRIERAWSPRTTFESDTCLYLSKHPSYMQCGVTALFLFFKFGGFLLECTINGQLHFMNFIKGEYVNLTMAQYPEGAEIDPGSIKECDVIRIVPNIVLYTRFMNYLENYFDDSIPDTATYADSERYAR